MDTDRRKGEVEGFYQKKKKETTLRRGLLRVSGHFCCDAWSSMSGAHWSEDKATCGDSR